MQLGSPPIVAPAGLLRSGPRISSSATARCSSWRWASRSPQSASRRRGAALWWALFGGDDAAERALTSATTQRRSALALSAFFYGNIPLLLGIVAIATGVQQAIERSFGQLPGGPARGPVALATGAALFLAGDVAFRRLLGLGPVLIRSITAAAVLATIAVGVTVTVEAQLALVAAMLVAEHYLAGASQATWDVAAGWSV